MRRERLTQVAVFIIRISAFLLITTLSAQMPAWKPVTTEGLKQFSAFYHLQPVLVRGNLFKTNNRLILQAETTEISILNLKNNDLLNIQESDTSDSNDQINSSDLESTIIKKIQ